MDSIKSEIWSHFSNKIDGKVQCLHCGQTLSVKNNSTSPLNRHMKQKHLSQSVCRQPTETNPIDSTKLELPKCLGGQKSKIWRHFSDKVDGKVKCLYCGQILSVKNKSTSTLIRHIKYKHSPASYSKQTMQFIPIALEQSTKPVESAKTSGLGKIETITSLFEEPELINTESENEIDKQLICMITKEYHPFGIVEDKEFKHLLYLLNPNYKIPTKETISNFLIPAYYNETVELVRSRLERAVAICLTTDGWTSRTNDNFYSITAHYIVEEDNNIFLSSDLLGVISYTERHTVENICCKLKEIIDDWEITNNIVAVVSDNSANMKEVVRIGGWPFWGCFAHSLNFVAQSGLKEIKEVIDKIKSIVSYFKRSNRAFTQLKESAEETKMSPLELKNDVATRWNSTYDMINRVTKMKNPITSTLTILRTSPYRNEGDIFESVHQLENDEWITAAQSLKVLEIFDLVTTAISLEQTISASTIIFYYKQINKHLNTFGLNGVTPQIKKMIERLQLELTERFHDIEINDLITEATILDPRFKKFGFVDQNKYKRAVESLYAKVANTFHDNQENIVVKEEQDSEQENENTTFEKENLLQGLWKDFEMEVEQFSNPTDPTASAIVEVDKYLDEPILPRKDSSGVCQDPLIWWHQRRHIYPKLYQIMKTRLCIMATSVPCERIFSKAGQVVNEKRELLKTDKISQVIFLGYNLCNND